MQTIQLILTTVSQQFKHNNKNYMIIYKLTVDTRENTCQLSRKARNNLYGQLILICKY